MTGKIGHPFRRWGRRSAGAEKQYRYRRFAAVFCLCVLSLAGCGGVNVPEKVDRPTVAVGKDGEVNVWQVGMFDKVDYVLSELQDMAVQEAAQFNVSSGKDAAVVVEKVEALGDGSGKVVVAYRFDGWESCSAFLEEDLFFGTVADAVLKGRSTGIALTSVKDDTPLSQEQLLKERDKSVIITDIKADIYCPGKVMYVSVGASVNEDGSIDTSGTEGTVCILFK